MLHSKDLSGEILSPNINEIFAESFARNLAKMTGNDHDGESLESTHNMSVVCTGRQMIRSDVRRAHTGVKALATKKKKKKKRLSQFEHCLLPWGEPTHSLDLPCHYDINVMPLKRCVCSVTRGQEWERTW